MALSKEDFTTISKFVRDNMAHLPPRPIKAHNIATLTSEAVNVSGAVSVGGVSQPKVTTSPLAQGPPLSPSDGDIWIATGVDSSGSRWQFQYDANWTTDAYRWKFIGGPARTSSNTVQVGVSPSTWTTFSDGTHSLSYLVARGGVYSISGQWSGMAGASVMTVQMGVSLAGGAPSWTNGTGIPAAGYYFNLALGSIDGAVPSGAAIALQLWENASTGGFFGATLNILPRRIA